MPLDTGKMAGPQAGKANGGFVKITLSDDAFLCPIYDGKTASLGRCIMCGYFPEEVYIFASRHTFCEECFRARTVSTADKTKAKIQPGAGRNVVVNINLQNTTLECPWCHELQSYTSIKEHIKAMHVECSREEARQSALKVQVTQPRTPMSVGQDFVARGRGSRGSPQTASPPSFGRQSKAIEKKPTDYSSSDTTLGRSHHESPNTEEATEEIVTCQYCNSPWEVSEMEEHQKNCPYREVKCHMCHKVITVQHYDKHVETHYQAGGTEYKGTEERNDRHKHPNEPPASIHSATAKPTKDNPGTREIKKEDESLTTPTPEIKENGGPDSRRTPNKIAPAEAAVPKAEQQDEEEVKKREEVITLKHKIKELEHRLQNLERPLEALIKRLRETAAEKKAPKFD